VLDTDISKAHYVSNINATWNPDILLGGEQSFLAGNHYFGYIQNDQESEDGQFEISDTSESELRDEFSAKPIRFFHTENKTIRCLNCKEIGHMARACPNETIFDLCKFCGTGHGRGQNCPAIHCFKCNQMGHMGPNCRAKEFSTC
jgi:hypothetical protein